MKISILTPSFNSGEYLERAIRSVIQQDDLDFEHIVVDGGSKDNTTEVLQKYPHLKWISERDNGQCDAMNKAFDMCTGDVVTYLNADDWFEPGVFAHIRSLFQTNPETDIVVGNLYSRFEDRDTVELVVPVKNYHHILLPFRYRFPLNPVCYFYRRAVQQSVGPFEETMHYGMDYWFLLRAFAGRRITETGMVMGTFFHNGRNKTAHSTTANDPEPIVRRHLREDNPSKRLFYYRHWFWNRYVREFPERIKQPVRSLVYHLFFSSKMSKADYRASGFRRAWNTAYGKKSS